MYGSFAAGAKKGMVTDALLPSMHVFVSCREAAFYFQSKNIQNMVLESIQKGLDNEDTFVGWWSKNGFVYHVEEYCTLMCLYTPIISKKEVNQMKLTTFKPESEYLDWIKKLPSNYDFL